MSLIDSDRPQIQGKSQIENDQDQIGLFQTDNSQIERPNDNILVPCYHINAQNDEFFGLPNGYDCNIDLCGDNSIITTQFLSVPMLTYFDYFSRPKMGNIHSRNQLDGFQHEESLFGHGNGNGNSIHSPINLRPSIPYTLKNECICCPLPTLSSNWVQIQSTGGLQSCLKNNQFESFVNCCGLYDNCIDCTQFNIMNKQSLHVEKPFVRSLP